MVCESGGAGMTGGGRGVLDDTERIEWFVSLISDRVTARRETSQNHILFVSIGLECRLPIFTRFAGLWTVGCGGVGVWAVS